MSNFPNKNALSADDLTRLAHMTRLAISPREVDPALRALNDILAMMEKLRQADVGDEDDLGHVQFWGDTLRLRDDVAVNGYPTQTLMDAAPKTANNCFITPKVIE